MIRGRKIWDVSCIPDREQSRLELTDIIRFNGDWYCGFREAEIHHNHPSGRARVIKSSDGEEWESAALMSWDGADVRAPRLCVTAEKWLMLYTSMYFVSPQVRDDGFYYQLDSRVPRTSDSEADGVMRQSVTWLSADGETWSSAYACPSGVNCFRWGVHWHNGMGYGVSYDGKDAKGALYRTRDGKSWRVLLEEFSPDGKGSEGSLAFGQDDTAYCVYRGNPRGAAIGIGKPPYYREWEWKSLSVDWDGSGTALPAEEILPAPFGGPKVICLDDGRLLCAARVVGPGRDNGHITLFWVDPEQALLTMVAEFDGTTYGGLFEHDGTAWVSYAASDASGIFLAKVEVPR